MAQCAGTPHSPSLSYWQGSLLVWWVLPGEVPQSAVSVPAAQYCGRTRRRLHRQGSLLVCSERRFRRSGLSGLVTLVSGFGWSPAPGAGVCATCMFPAKSWKSEIFLVEISTTPRVGSRRTASISR